MFVKVYTRTMLVCFGLAAVTALLYWPLLRSDFIIYDDPYYIFTNPHVNQGFSLNGIKWAFQAGYAANWHPLTWLSHMLDCQLFGLKPAGHHAVSVLIHALNSVLVFLVFRRLTGAFWRSAMVAALFAWHPLHVESVAWISERKDVLCAFFFLLSLWFYAGYAKKRENEEGPDQKWSFFLALLCFSLALLSKPMAVTLPCVLLLLDFWPLGRVKVGNGLAVNNPSPGSISHLLLEKVPFLLLAIGCSVLTVVAQNRGQAISSLDYFPLPARLANVVMSYFGYLKKMIWPADLAVIYPRVVWLFGFEIIAAALCLAAISNAAARQWKTRPYWLIGWLWYLGMLVPVIGFLTVGGIAMADRFTYLPLIGIFMVICWDINETSGVWRHRERILTGAAVVALAACLVISSIQIGYWKNSASIFEHTIQVTRNNYIAHANYAMALSQQQQFERARIECEKSIKIAPTYAWARVFLADILLRMGRTEEAAKSADAALHLRPDMTGAYLILGQICLNKNKPVEAAALFETGKKYPQAPASLELLLGQALIMQKKMDEAGSHLALFTKLMPQAPEGHFQYALALAGSHRTKEAVAEYRQTLALAPDDPLALNNLAWILAADPRPEFRNGPEAVRLADRACEVTRNGEAVMIGTLAVACAEAGRFDEAVKVAQKAHDVALAHGEKELAARNLEMLKLFQSKKAYHEPAF